MISMVKKDWFVVLVVVPIVAIDRSPTISTDLDHRSLYSNPLKMFSENSLVPTLSPISLMSMTTYTTKLVHTIIVVTGQATVPLLLQDEATHIILQVTSIDHNK